MTRDANVKQISNETLKKLRRILDEATAMQIEKRGSRMNFRGERLEQRLDQHGWRTGFALMVMAAMTVALICTGLASAAGRPRPHRPAVDTGANVILVTLDGVRWQEFFGSAPDPRMSHGDQREIFPHLWRTLSREGAMFGSPRTTSRMVVSNPVKVSLPGYQSIMAGRAQFCLNNECSRIGRETFPERVSRELGLARGQVAAIASWKKIPLAFESQEGALFVNAGQMPLSDPSGSDPELVRINQLQAKDPPVWGSARKDQYTCCLLYTSPSPRD